MIPYVHIGGGLRAPRSQRQRQLLAVRKCAAPATHRPRDALDILDIGSAVSCDLVSFTQRGYCAIRLNDVPAFCHMTRALRRRKRTSADCQSGSGPWHARTRGCFSSTRRTSRPDGRDMTSPCWPRSAQGPGHRESAGNWKYRCKYRRK